METEPLARLDSFPYRHGVSDMMSAPAATIDGGAAVSEAARAMVDRRVSSLLVLNADVLAAGIVTERDVLRLVAAGRLDRPIAVKDAMSAPVHTIEADALVYRALARMARLNIRHLPVVDDQGRPVGMLTSGALLKQRASLALTLGDEVATARDALALRAAHDSLPRLAGSLLDEHASAAEIAAVIAGVTRDLTARSGELALAEMAAAGRGKPPGRWCLLVLGSAGRGESLLAPDQDNALILDDGVAGDAWFADFGERLNRLLDEAGVPYCKGGVMAGKPDYRRGLTAWSEQIDSWAAHPQPQALLNADIFLDFAPVLGEVSLAGQLRRHAAAAISRAPAFLRLLAERGATGSAFDLLGRFRLNDGRLDLKLHGLLPIVSGARVMSLAWAGSARSTEGRLSQARVAGALAPDIAQELAEAQITILDAILHQQLADFAAGRPRDNLVDPRGLGRAASDRLRKALRLAADMPEIVRDTLSNRDPARAP
jgi:signal-transduction protein with cAMP-binding, CBS, and nucleotidyltransferase domain